MNSDSNYNTTSRCTDTTSETCENSTCGESNCSNCHPESTCETSSIYCNTSDTTCDTSNTTCDTSNTTCDTSNTTCDTSNTTCDTSNTTCDTTDTSCNTLSNTSDSSNCSNTSSNTECSTYVSQMGTISENNIYEESCECNDIDVLDNNADIFVNSHHCIHYNTDRGVSYETPMVLGTNKLSKVAGFEEIMNKTTTPVLAINGDVYVSGHIYTGNLNASTEAKHVHADVGGSILKHKYDKYINAKPPNLIEGGLQNVTYYHISPSDNTNILYVNPIHGPVYIILGSESGETNFNPNKSITIKDVSLMYNEGSSYNIYITTVASVKNHEQVYIEHYDASCRLKVSGPGTYVLNTSNGSVTYRYMKSLSANSKSCWLIDHQFIGNQRVLPGKGLVFNTSQQTHVKKLLNQ